MASGTLTDNVSTDWVKIHTGTFMLNLTGAFGSGIVQLQMLAQNGVTALDVTSAAWSAAIVGAHIDLVTHDQVRLTMAGATAPSVAWEIKESRVG